MFGSTTTLCLGVPSGLCKSAPASRLLTRDFSVKFHSVTLKIRVSEVVHMKLISGEYCVLIGTFDEREASALGKHRFFRSRSPEASRKAE